MDRRARLTITDIVYVVIALAALAALYPAYRGVLASAEGLDAGTAMIFQTVLPVAVIVLLAIVYVESRGGAA